MKSVNVLKEREKRRKGGREGGDRVTTKGT